MATARACRRPARAGRRGELTRRGARAAQAAPNPNAGLNRFLARIRRVARAGVRRRRLVEAVQNDAAWRTPPGLRPHGLTPRGRALPGGCCLGRCRVGQAAWAEAAWADAAWSDAAWADASEADQFDLDAATASPLDEAAAAADPALTFRP